MRIQIINPNTTASFTSLSLECGRAAAAPGTEIRACQPAIGTPSVECHIDEAVATLGIIGAIQAGEANGVDGHVIACFGDTGLDAAREAARGPVVGMTEAALYAAALIAPVFSIVTLPRRTGIFAERVLWHAGLERRCAKVRAIDVDVLDCDAPSTRVFDAFAAEAARAIEEDRAEAIILGCAGLEPFAGPLIERLGVPVIEGVSAAVKMVEALLSLRLATSKRGRLGISAAKIVDGRRGSSLAGTAGRAVTTIIRNVRVLTLDASGTEHACATVVVQNDRIARVDPGNATQFEGSGTSEVREIDGSGHLLMPGLINAHFHSSVNHLKGSLESLPLEVFMLHESPAEGAAMDPRAVYVRTMLGALEMLKTGVTTVLDDAFFVPAPTPAAIDALMQAYQDSGIRATVALDQPNVAELDKLPFLAQLLPPALRSRAAAPPAMDAEGLLTCYAHLLNRWHGAEGGRLRAAVSCSAPQRVTPAYFRALDALSRQHDLPFYVHVLETKLQRVFGAECLGGRSLVRYVADLGVLSERLNLIHGVWLDERDMDLIAHAGAVIAHNPISNLRLGSGIMPFRALRARGIPICLGSDESIADDAVNMWAVAKLAGLIHNITRVDYADWPKAHEILDCLIRGGARALRSPVPIGQVATGYQADLILVDLDTLAFTPLNDLKRQLIYCESGSSVRMTMVAGRIVYEDGRVTTVDERSLRAEAREQAARHQSMRGVDEEAARMWIPYYRQMYLMAAERDVGMHRWAGDGE